MVSEVSPSWERRMAVGQETRIGIQDDGSENLWIIRREGGFEVRDRAYEYIFVDDADTGKLAAALGVTCGEGCTGSGCSICEALHGS